MIPSLRQIELRSAVREHMAMRHAVGGWDAAHEWLATHCLGDAPPASMRSSASTSTASGCSTPRWMLYTPEDSRAAMGDVAEAYNSPRRAALLDALIACAPLCAGALYDVTAQELAWICDIDVHAVWHHAFELELDWAVPGDFAEAMVRALHSGRWHELTPIDRARVSFTAWQFEDGGDVFEDFYRCRIDASRRLRHTQALRYWTERRAEDLAELEAGT